MVRVIGLDPLPQGAATTSAGTAPSDGFFTSAGYRGAFDPNAANWLAGWSAADAFGFLRCKQTSQFSNPSPASRSGV
jgi:hypothetical protein